MPVQPLHIVNLNALSQEGRLEHPQRLEFAPVRKTETPITRARKTLVDSETTSYYHCIGRCVRRAWLWGEDRVSGRNYEHRKAWVSARLAELADVFTIDVCAYAVMSNHYHLVLRLDTEKARALSEEEVIARYGRLFKMPVLIERYLDGLTTDAENAVAQTILGQLCFGIGSAQS